MCVRSDVFVVHTVQLFCFLHIFMKFAVILINIRLYIELQSLDKQQLVFACLIAGWMIPVSWTDSYVLTTVQ